MLRTLALVLLLSPPLVAGGKVVVPRDYPTLEAAVRACNPGDVVLVRTTTPQHGVTVDKPLTIVGDPLAVVYAGAAFPYPCADAAAFELAGPGYGTLTLSNVEILPAGDCFDPPAGIEGGGFDELHIHDSRIRAGRAGSGGTGRGAPGIAVDVPFLQIVGSFVSGQNPDAESCSNRLPDEREAGIDAPASTVLMLDSLVVGGGWGKLCCEYCFCPPHIGGLGGSGGDGVIAYRLFETNSVQLGGRGSTYVAYPGLEPEGGGVPCGKQPDGTGFAVHQHVALANDAYGSGPMRLGRTWDLGWNTPGPAAALLASFDPTPPTLVAGMGWVFSSAATTFLVGVVPAGGPRTLALPIPARPGLVGVPIVLQLFDATSGLTRPVSSVIVP